MEREKKTRSNSEDDAKYRSGPVDAREKFDKDYSGYSEAQTDMTNEIHAGEWQSLSRFKTYRNRSRQGKILATHQAVSNRLRELEQMYYALVRDNPNKGERLLYQIKQLRLIQDVLLQCLVWEPAGKLDESMVPPEVWELIK